MGLQKNDHIHNDKLFVISKSGLKRSLSVCNSDNLSSPDCKLDLISNDSKINEISEMNINREDNYSTIENTLENSSCNMDNTKVDLFDNIFKFNTLGDINLHSENKKKSRDEIISAEYDNMDNLSQTMLCLSDEN